MAVITFGSSSGQAGDAISVTLTKSELVEIVGTPYYEDQEVWNKVYAVISSEDQEQQVNVTSGSGTFQTSTTAQRGTWTLTSINIVDYDGGVERVTSGFGTVTFTIIGPDQPTVSAPTNGATDVTFPLTFSTSAYNVTGAANDTHTQSDFVIKDGSDTTVFASRDDASNLETISVPETGFSTSTTYYARARHEGGTYGNSPWSDSVSFTTAASLYPLATAEVDAERATAFGVTTSYAAYPYITENKDVNSEYNSTTGIFTASEAGNFIVQATIFMRLTFTAGTGIFVGIFKNGSLYKEIELKSIETQTINRSIYIDDIVPLSASDTLSIRVKQDIGGTLNTWTGAPYFKLNVYGI